MGAIHITRRTLLAVIALFAVAASTGCSCDESNQDADAGGGRVVVVKEAAPKPVPQEPAPERKAPQPPRAARQPDDYGDSVIQAPANYLRATTITVPRHITSQARLAQTQNEINQFKALEGRYPYSLKELEQWRGAALQSVPSGYAYKYDSETGKLDVVRIPPAQ